MTEYIYNDSEDRADVIESIERFIMPPIENFMNGRYLFEIVNQDCNYVYIRLIDKHTRRKTWTTELLKSELWNNLTSLTCSSYTLEILKLYGLIITTRRVY